MPDQIIAISLAGEPFLDVLLHDRGGLYLPTAVDPEGRGTSRWTIQQLQAAALVLTALDCRITDEDLMSLHRPIVDAMLSLDWLQDAAGRVACDVRVSLSTEDGRRFLSLVTCGSPIRPAGALAVIDGEGGDQCDDE
jgi:hypothetical protein